MAQREGAALVIDSSTQGDGGTVFVAQATVPSTQPSTGFGRGGGGGRNSPYSVDSPPMPPQATMAVEHFNRLVRMIQQGEELKMAVDFKVQYHADDLMAYNTIAEIPGTDPDLKDQIVMAGGHMDSWQSGTGATDNGVGVVAAMEAVRIIKAIDLKPRRTIRIALWTGEEEGLLGSRAYVSKHFGHFGPLTAGSATQPTTRSGALVKESEYDKLSCYFNLDNGTGKIRGIYMQANDAARPYFAKWIAPFGDLDASTITPSNTGSTDHISFDTIGLPGFQFIQDPIEYFSRTHHSSADVFDRIQADDLKQAATVMAAILFDAAQMDERFPRKPMRVRE
jgi:carboxypeptidase Q